MQAIWCNITIYDMSGSSISIVQKRSLHKLLNPSLAPYFVTALVVLFTVFRDTRFFTQPRFWAEEGTLHFAYSYSHGWLQALFQPQIGYLNFWPNLATLLATLPPLEMAPLVTTLMALIVQLVPVALILWSKSPLWNSWIRKIVGVAVVVFSPLTTEVWLNSVNSYTYFAAITFLLLIEEIPQQRTRQWVYRVLLLLGGLSGTQSCFLIPFFIFRAFMDKQIERWRQVAILSACAAVQLFMIFSYHSSQSFEERFHPVGLAALGTTLWMQSIALFALGVDQANRIVHQIYSLIYQNLPGFQILGGFLLICAILFFILSSNNLRLKMRIIFLGSYATLVWLPMIFSAIKDKYSLFETGYHQRLFLAPNIIFGLMLLLGVHFTKEKGWKSAIKNVASLICVILVSASLLWGVYYFRSDRWFLATYWPDWKTEVQTWKDNPGYSLRIQPESWNIDLRPK